ncbi:MAG: DUF6364 family protein [Bacteroidota bacterium]|jgi:hypothetical protein
MKRGKTKSENRPKLTLSVSEDVIEKAKMYAAKHNQSISSLVENYLASLVKEGVGAYAPVNSELQALHSLLKKSKVKRKLKLEEERLNYLLNKNE